MDHSLETKLAAVVAYIDNRRHKRVNADERALNSYLDDPEVAAWLTKMDKEGRVRPHRFISK